MCNYQLFVQQIETGIDMKAQFRARPESKGLKKVIKPADRYINSEQAQQSFKKGKQQQQASAYNRAIEHYLRALMYDPKYFQAYCNMGSCYRTQGKYLQARSMYLKAISIKNDDVISHYNLANVLRLIGNYEESIQHYQLAINLAENQENQSAISLYGNSLVNLGICFKITEQYDKAIICYEKARKNDPNDESIIFNEAMAYMANLKSIDTDIFYEVSKEKAYKAEQLLKKISKTNSNYQLVSIKLIRISSILDRTTENLSNLIKKLKEMLPKSVQLKDDINEEIGHILKLLEDYEKSASHYQSTKNNFLSNKISEQQTPNLYDNSAAYPASQPTIFTEQQAIKLIEQQQYQFVQEKLQTLEKNSLEKHLIEIALSIALSLTDDSGAQLSKANQIYLKYFTEKGKDLPFDKYSITAHKVIGTLFSRQGKYKESISHFQYISEKLKDNNEKSKIHSSIGNDYEALGDMQKALTQYKMALEQEPQNYQLVYNIGCCLHEQGNHEQSNKHFEKFLQLIKNDPKVEITTKNLYIADCLVTIAGSSKPQEEYKRYQQAWNAIKQIEQTEDNQKLQFDEEKMMNYFLKWADLLEEKIMKIEDKKSQEHIKSQQTLLQTYMNLLEYPNCPDRDAILNNCAIIYYEQKLYVNALANLNQVVISNTLSLNSLALTYLHLGQHYMATRSIYQAAERDEQDEIISFNKEVIEWIYGISEDGRLNQIYSNYDDSLIIIRWQYALLVIDAFSKMLKGMSEEEASNSISEQIDNFIKQNKTEEYLDGMEKVKARYFTEQLKKSHSSTNKEKRISETLIRSCIESSKDVEKDLRSLLTTLKKSQYHQTLQQLLISLFIFTNRVKVDNIAKTLKQFGKIKQQTLRIDLDRRVTIDEQLLSHEFNFENINDIVSNFCTWQCQLENKLIFLVTLIEKTFYNCKFRSPLEFQYHFPRHSEIIQCTVTLNRIAELIYGAFSVQQNFKHTSQNLQQIKSSIINELENDFQLKMRGETLFSLHISDKLLVMTLHAAFQSKEQCIKFIRVLHKQSSHKKQLEFIRDSEQIILIVSKVLKVRCTWTPKDTVNFIIHQIKASPLPMDIQSILEIDSDINLLQQANPSLWEQIKAMPAFRT